MKNIEFNREQAKAKKCLKQLVDSYCTFSAVVQEALDLDLGEYNPFCSNHRDPGATGKDQCDGVKDLNNPLTAAAEDQGKTLSAAAGPNVSVMQALLLSFVSLLFFVKI